MLGPGGKELRHMAFSGRACAAPRLADRWRVTPGGRVVRTSILDAGTVVRVSPPGCPWS